MEFVRVRFVGLIWLPAGMSADVRNKCVEPLSFKMRLLPKILAQVTATGESGKEGDSASWFVSSSTRIRRNNAGPFVRTFGRLPSGVFS